MIIYVRDAKTGKLIPIKATDNGDGTYTSGHSLEAIKKNNEVA